MKPLNIRPLLRFLLWFVVSYILLLISFSFLADQFAQQYRAIGKAKFEQFEDRGIVQFFPYEKDKTGYKLDTKVVLFNRDQVIAAKQSGQATVRGAELFVSSWYNAVLPIIILLSLILASPVSWKRKLMGAFIGIILLYLFVFFKLRLSIANEYLKTPSLEFIPPNPNWVKTAHAIFVTNIETTIILPVFIWILVTFRKTDLQKFSTYSKG